MVWVNKLVNQMYLQNILDEEQIRDILGTKQRFSKIDNESNQEMMILNYNVNLLYKIMKFALNML